MLRFAITDRHLGVPAGDRSKPGIEQHLIARCAALAAQGIDYLLIREKDLAAGELVVLSRNILAAVRTANPATKVLIARRPDIALAIGTDGVHLSAATGELTPGDVRQLMPNAFISVSCHTLAEVERARDLGASAILFGPIFGKDINGVEVVHGIGLDQLREACTVAGDIPIFALGGITEATIPACKSAGASGIAAIRLFFATEELSTQNSPTLNS
jgi:thiamine-phosphate pyrophosphorylase